MTIRALIVDDEPVARRRLRTLLAREKGVEVAGECEDGEGAIEAIRRLRPDVVFLDVQMPGFDGFDVVKALAPAEQPAVVFVTAYDKYAVRAFDVHAVDYLLKPFEPGRLRRALDRLADLRDARDARRRLQAAVEAARAGQPLRRVLVKSGSRVFAVRVEEIDSLHAAGHYVELWVGAARHLVRESMAHLEERLDSARFARIHRGVIVNVDRIRELLPSFHGEFEVVLKDGRRLRCSRTYAGGLTRTLGS